MKTLRRISTAVICILLIALCTFTAAAKDKRYSIKELDMSMEFPDTMTVFTRETEGVNLGENIYLTAVGTDGKLSMYVSMIQNDKTKEVYSFENLSSEALEAYKDEILQNDEYTNCRNGTYGKVSFLDFSQKYSENSVDIYGRQSITLINGMSIYITSQSIGDDFTTEELNLIKGCLDSIKFKEVNLEEPHVNALAIVIWIIVILLLIAGIFLVVAFFLGKQKAQQNRSRRLEKKRRAREEFDEFGSTDSTVKPKENGRLSGYKSSGDYFESFDDDSLLTVQGKSELMTAKRDDSFLKKIVDILKTVALGVKTLFTRLGYFFTNLKRLIKSTSGKKKGGKKRSRQVRRGASKEYDVFRDR